MDSTKLDRESMLTTKEAAHVLGLSSGTLAVWRHYKRTPFPYHKKGRMVRYKYGDLIDYMESTRVEVELDTDEG